MTKAVSVRTEYMCTVVHAVCFVEVERSLHQMTHVKTRLATPH